MTRFGGDSTIDLSPYITIEWEAPFETNGAPVLGFKVEISMNTGAYEKAYDGSSNPVQKSFKF